MSYSEQSRPSHDAIARRAYELFLERGGQGGDASQDWLRAEAELVGRTTEPQDTRRAETAQAKAAPRKARSPRRKPATESAEPTRTTRPRLANGKAASKAAEPAAAARPRRASKRV